MNDKSCISPAHYNRSYGSAMQCIHFIMYSKNMCNLMHKGLQGNQGPPGEKGPKVFYIL
jgi:hypothetical protein